MILTVKLTLADLHIIEEYVIGLDRGLCSPGVLLVIAMYYIYSAL